MADDRDQTTVARTTMDCRHRKVAIVSIARDEKPFLNEWLLYHRLIEIDHIFVYDDEPNSGLQDFLRPHAKYATVIRWHDQHQKFSSPRGDRQTKAYLHALKHFLPEYKWVAFIDVDEFIILEKDSNIKRFLTHFENASAIYLKWRVFGHNGHYEDPNGLVTASLTRRTRLPDEHWGKSITRCNKISNILSPHHCELINGQTVSADNLAHVNHYKCRSFKHWIDRVKRGYVSQKPYHERNAWNAWRTSEEGCLRTFVEKIALNWNEHVDEEMLQFKPRLEQAIKLINEIREKETRK
jgi:hypothetical protein